MPAYKVTDPTSGRTITLTGDTPPSEDDINQAFAQAPQSQSNNQQNTQTGTGNPVLDWLSKTLLPTASKTFQTIGADLGFNGGQQTQNSQQAAYNSANALIQRANTVTDPAEKQRLLLLSQQINQGTSNSTNSIVSNAQQNMPVANSNIGSTALKSATEIGSNFVPFGAEGTGIIKGAVLPGAIQGGMQAYSQDKNIGAGAVAGGTTAGAFQALSNLLSPLLSKGGGALETGGVKMLDSQYNVKPSDRVNNKIFNTVQSMADYGATTPEQVANMAKQVTGQDGIVNQIKQQAIAQADPVNINGMSQEVKDILGDKAFINGTKTGTNFQQIVSRGLSGAASDGENFTSLDPTKAFKLIQQWEGEGNDLLTPSQMGGQPNGTEKQLGNAYLQVADNLKNRLFQNSGADSQVLSNVITPEQYQQLHSISPKLAQQVTNASTVKDLRAIEAPFVRGSNLANQSVQRSTNKPVDLLDTILAVGSHLDPKVLTMLGAKKLLTSDMGKSAIGTGMMKTGQVMQGVGNNVSVPNNYQALMKMLGVKGIVNGL